MKNKKHKNQGFCTYNFFSKNRKAAMEMSVGTIVTIVLLMTVLILGIFLVQKIFSGAKYNVDQINDKVTDEINKLFSEDKRVVIYLPNRLAEIKQGEQWGIGFGIRNTIASQEFGWEVRVADSRIRDKCGVTSDQAEAWVVTGEAGSVGIDTGQPQVEVIRFNIPEGQVSDISSCIVRYQLVVKKEDGTSYQTESFDVDVK